MPIVIAVTFNDTSTLPKTIRKNFCIELKTVMPTSTKNWKTHLKRAIQQSFNYASKSKSTVKLNDLDVKKKSVVVFIETPTTNYTLPCQITIKTI